MYKNFKLILINENLDKKTIQFDNLKLSKLPQSVLKTLKF